ncbi:MAG: cell division protein ZapA [Prevotella sp.]|nr:cell division protein ZapA [Prevotella sp.]
MSEENKEKLHIRLRVCDSEIPIRIIREEEEVYRRAASRVTSIVNVYNNRAQGKKSTIDILYMALIDIALKYEKEVKRNDTKPFNDILATLTKEIEEALDDNR